MTTFSRRSILIPLLVSMICALHNSNAQMVIPHAAGGSTGVHMVSPSTVRELQQPRFEHGTIPQINPPSIDLEYAKKQPFLRPSSALVVPVEDQFEATVTSTAPGIDQSFSGFSYTNWYPPDATIAAGLDHIVVLVNSSWAVRSKSGNLLYETTLDEWFSALDPPGSPFDPWVIYDVHRERWVFIATAKDSSSQESVYLLSVSATSDPMGSWYIYSLDATLDGSAPTSNLADYPKLGYDDVGGLYVTSNQFDFPSGQFQYTKIRVLRKDELYSGSSEITWYDFWDLKNQSGSKVASLQPVQTLDHEGTEWLLNNVDSGSGDAMTLWSVAQPTSETPQLVRQGALVVGEYTAPPDAQQAGGVELIDTGDCRLLHAVLRNGHIYTCFHHKYDWGSGDVSAIRFVELDAPTRSLVGNTTWGADGYYYYYPTIVADKRANVYATFSRSSGDEYAGTRITGWRLTEKTPGPSISAKSGEAYYLRKDGSDRNRWGDYAGAALDPTTDGGWVYAQYASTGNKWGTWISGLSFLDPADDLYEENDVQASAYDPGYDWEGDWLSSVAGKAIKADEDWYSLDIGPENDLRFSMDCRFDHSLGDIDVALVDSAGQEVARSNSVTDDEHVDTTVPSAGRYFVRVYYENRGNTYDLRWTDSHCVDGDGDGVCSQSDCDDDDPNNWNSCSTCQDTDGDGYFAACDAYSTIPGPDCSDDNSTVYPGAEQICDRINNNCDDSIYPDPPRDEEDLDGDGYAPCEGDCDDDTSKCGSSCGPQYLTEIDCSDGYDNDCDDKVDAEDADCSSSGYTVSGRTLYYRDGNGEPAEPEKPVAGATIRFYDPDDGSIVDEETTDESGTYSYDATTAPICSHGYKKGDISHVSAYDASLTARYAVQEISLTTLQQLAADTSGNGQITAYDASLIAQLAVKKISKFPQADKQSPPSDWAFRYDDDGNGVYDEDRCYDIAQDETNQDYLSVLFGDVSGNWNVGKDVPDPRIGDASAWRYSRSKRHAAHGSSTGSVNVITRVPLATEGGISSVDIRIIFGAEAQPDSMTVRVKGAAARIAGHYDPIGRVLRIAIYGTDPFGANAELLVETEGVLPEKLLASSDEGPWRRLRTMPSRIQRY